MSLSCRLCGAGIPAAGLTLDPAPRSAQGFAADVTGARNARIALQIAQCPDCGLVQSLSAPVPYYRSVITAAGLSASMREYRARQFSEFVAHYDLRGSRCLEVGCGKGHMLPLLHEAGLDPAGLEATGAEAGGIGAFPVLEGYPSGRVPLPGAPYRSVVCLNFLEHAPEPRAFLRSMAASLEPDGVALIEVPNYDQQRRLGRAFDYVADHLSYFDESTLRLAAELSGFTVERIGTTRGGENVEAWVRPRRPNTLRDEARLVAATRENLDRLVCRFAQEGQTVACWGASHQALTVLADLADSPIVGIFDSAPFKQGKHAPGCGLPILKPESAAFAELDNVIVIASGYEAEIVASLRRAFHFTGRIWTLEGQELVEYDER